MQIRGGIAVIVISDGSLTPLGVPLILHGINNVYENGMYFITGNENVKDPIRELYQLGAESVNMEESDGNLAYYYVDLGLSLYGLFGNTALKPGTRKLFRYIPSDRCRGIQVITKFGLASEASGDGVTIQSIHDELRHKRVAQ